MSRRGISQPLCVGITGLRQGAAHARALAARDDCQVVALCDAAAEPLERVGDEHGVASRMRFDDYQRMLAEANLDAVVVATPVDTHESMAVEALQRGIHVLLEKPMASDLASAQRIKQTADASEAVLQIGFEFRSSPLIRKANQLIAAGELGEVAVVWTRMFRGPAVTAANGWRGRCGLFFDCMIHELDGLMHFAGADFERVAAFGAPQGMKTPKPSDRPAETVTACVEFENAVRGSIAFSELSQTYENTQFGIVGDKGRIDGSMWEPEGAGSLRLYTEGGLYRTTIEINGSQTTRGHLGFVEQYDFFLATVRQGEPNVSDAANGLRVQRFLAAFERAMREDRTIQHNEFRNPQNTSTGAVV
ncbi:MAG: Gfo/Idh/MocA family protein [Phycisphaeraceae bacterium]